MKRTITSNSFSLRSLFALTLAGLMAFAVSCKKDKPPKELKDFVQVNLVGNNDKYAPARVDPLLLNAWGLSWSATGVAWVSSTGGGVSTVYNGEGGQVRPAVAIPSPGGNTGGLPTGQAFNGGTGFVLSNGQPARFIFVGVDGILSAWNGAAANNALLVKNNSATSAYTGLTLAMSNGAPHLYAADFRAGKIEVWNQAWDVVPMTFKDPYLPNGYAPFNVQVVGTMLYVTYAEVGPDGRDVPGQGNGFVSIFTTEGQFVKRFASRGALNAPWGVAAAPDSFFVDTEDANVMKGGHDEFEGPVVLIGNFGDGRINAYSQYGRFLGPLRKKGRAIEIDGLWAISFAPTTSTISQDRLYFTAGPDKEANGLFGYIIKE
jgi:uncharacterized protein (TIGR03118 family)